MRNKMINRLTVVGTVVSGREDMLGIDGKDKIQFKIHAGESPLAEKYPQHESDPYLEMVVETDFDDMYVKKGSIIAVTGSVRSDFITDADGVTKNLNKIIAEKVELISEPTKAGCGTSPLEQAYRGEAAFRIHESGEKYVDKDGNEATDEAIGRIAARMFKDESLDEDIRDAVDRAAKLEGYATV